MKRRGLVPLLLALVTLMVACESNRPWLISPSGNAPVTITFACDDHEMEAYRALARQFEAAHPDIAIRVLSINEIVGATGDQWPQDAGLRVLSAADTARWYASPQETRQGIIQDLTPFMEADASFQADDFYPAVLESCRWDDGTWCLPDGAEMAVLFFDKAAFDQAGKPYPQPGWSWQEFEITAKALVKQEGNQITRYGYVLPWSHFLLTAYLADHDIPLEDRTTTPSTPRLDDPAVVRAVRWYVNLMRAVAPYDPPQDRSTRARALIDEGRVALWTWFGGYDALPSPTVGVVPFPGDGGNTTPLMIFGHVMSAGSDHPNEAWRWLDFLSRQGPVGLSGAPLPTRRSVAQAGGFWEKLDEDLAETLRYALDHALVQTPIAFDPTHQALEQAVETILSGEQDVEQALAEAQQAALANRPQALPTVEIHVAPAATPTSPHATGAKATITFIGGYGDLSAYRKLARRFQQDHPGITVRVRPEPDYEDWMGISQLVKAGDCFRWLAGVDAADSQYLLDLDPFLDADPAFPQEDYYPAFWHQCEQQGKIWCLPFDGNVRVIRYNKALFDAAGVAYPQAGWSLDDFLDKATALTVGEEPDKQYGFASYGNESSALSMFIGSLGGSLWETDTFPPRPRFHDPAVVEAVQQYADLARVQGIKPAVPLVSPSRGLPTEGQKTMRLVETGRVAMWTWFAHISPYAPEVLTASGMVPFPQSGDRPLPPAVINYAHFISAQTEHPQACWDWLRFLSDRPEAVEGVPTRRSLTESAAFRQKVGDEAAAVYLYALDRPADLESQVMARHPWAWRATYWFNRAYDAVLEGADAAQALDQAQRQAEAYILCLETNQAFEDSERTLACARQVDPDYPGLPWEE